MELLSFSTDRLTLRHWRDALAHPARRNQLERDILPILTPKVLAHLPPSLQTRQTPSAINHWVTKRAQESDVYTISDRTKDQLIGLLILAAPEQADHIHLGYLLDEPAWGLGYASEILQGLAVQFAHQTVQLTAGVGHDNPASARVLEKAGFKQDADQSNDSTLIYVWNGTHEAV